MRTINSPENSRNYGFWNEAEQRALIEAHVAIAGVGGDGFQLGQKLAQMGVQNFSIADPEVFEPENTNRVPGATTSTYGRNKAEVFREKVKDINPDAQVRVFTEGVLPENIEEFMYGADLVLDESELTHLEIGALIARQAIKQSIPDLLVMNIGFAAQATSFDPYGKKTFEDFMGIPRGMPLDEIADLELDLSRCVPYIPKYADLSTLKAVKEGASLPSIAQGVDIASALGSSQAFLHITQKVGNKRPQPVWAPRIRYMDALDGTSGETSFPRLSHYRTLMHAAARQYLGRNSEASYSLADRERREAAAKAGL